MARMLRSDDRRMLRSKREESTVQPLGPDHWITCGGGGQCTTCIAFANRFFYPLSEWAIHPPATSPSGLGLDCSSALLALLCCLLQRLRRRHKMVAAAMYTPTPHEAEGLAGIRGRGRRMNLLKSINKLCPITNAHAYILTTRRTAVR